MKPKELLRLDRKLSKQHTFIYCPKCKNELISSDSFIKDEDGILKYKCTKCGNVSFWDFIHYPIPYLITCGRDCRHFRMDKSGQDYTCKYEKICSPDTMYKFEYHGVGCEYCDEILDCITEISINYCPMCGKKLKDSRKEKR